MPAYEKPPARRADVYSCALRAEDWYACGRGRRQGMPTFKQDPGAVQKILRCAQDDKSTVRRLSGGRFYNRPYGSAFSAKQNRSAAPRVGMDPQIHPPAQRYFNPRAAQQEVGSFVQKELARSD